MISTASLSGSNLLTYQQILQKPDVSGLPWNHVHCLMRHLGHVEQEPGGDWKVTRNDRVLHLGNPGVDGLVGVKDLEQLQHFLKDSERIPPASNGREAHLLLVIDHQGARLFRSEVTGGIPVRILPHLVSDFTSAEPGHHTARPWPTATALPAPNFFEPVARELHAAGQILVIGTGTKVGSEMDSFLVWVREHHPELEPRIIGSVVIDEQHLSEEKLLQKAREAYACRISNEALGTGE